MTGCWNCSTSTVASRPCWSSRKSDRNRRPPHANASARCARAHSTKSNTSCCATICIRNVPPKACKPKRPASGRPTFPWAHFSLDRVDRLEMKHLLAQWDLWDEQLAETEEAIAFCHTGEFGQLLGPDAGLSQLRRGHRSAGFDHQAGQRDRPLYSRANGAACSAKGSGDAGLVCSHQETPRREASLRCHVDSSPRGLSVSLIKTTRYREAVAKNTPCRKSPALRSVCSKQPYSRRDV